MFENEDHFQTFFIRNFGRSFLEDGDLVSAKISKIGGEFIRPEIDLLGITPVIPGQIISAFEFKVLNLGRAGGNYNRIYAGIGQAISYFKYGVDRSYLIVGLSDNIEGADRSVLRRMIVAFANIVGQLHVDRFQVRMYDELHNEVWDIPFLSPAGRFEIGTRLHRSFLGRVELARNNLLAGNFSKTKGNNFFRKFGLDHMFEHDSGSWVFSYGASPLS